MSGKYGRLEEYLLSFQGNLWRATFADVEEVLGFQLPKSARDHQAWWANARDGAAQKGAWLGAGWRTENLNLTAERVDFRRAGMPKLRPRAPTTAPSPRGPTASLTLRWTWQQLGSVTLETNGRLTFPRAPATPSVYRFVIVGPRAMRRYIGESDNLLRRFGNYRHPGPTQKTSLRINGELKAALTQAGTQVTVSIVQDVQLGLGAVKRPLALAQKAERRLLEQAVLVAETGELLNR